MPRQTQLAIHVAAGILQNDAGEVLLAERLGDGPFRGLWEFPGGKVNDGESAQAALQRELREELGIDVTTSKFFLRLTHQYDDRTVDLEFFKVSKWRGEPAGLEGQQLRWAAVADMNAAELLPADAPLLDALRENR
ncbi:MAG: 8-oxo-dGTP diphosphatase MutT [Woeseiaceae bacterium]